MGLKKVHGISDEKEDVPYFLLTISFFAFMVRQMVKGQTCNFSTNRKGGEGAISLQCQGLFVGVSEREFLAF
jgi:hypothetical protein